MKKRYFGVTIAVVIVLVFACLALKGMIQKQSKNTGVPGIDPQTVVETSDDSNGEYLNSSQVEYKPQN